MTTRRIYLASVLAVAAIGLTACSGGDGASTAKAEAPATTAKPTTTRARPTTTTEAPTTTAAPPTTTEASTTTQPPTTTAPSTTQAPPPPPPTTPPPPPTEPPPPPPPAGDVVTVTHVVDGDTVDVSTGQRVRVIGIDTPERGECGFEEATDRMTALVGGAAVTLVGGARDDVDRYGRILRYVDGPKGDAGRTLIAEGLSIARYDSRDGYGGHPREADYVALDAATPNLCTNLPPAPDPTPAPHVDPTPSSGGGGGDCERSYPTLCLPRGHDVDCGEIGARKFEVLAPDPYRLDANHNGIGCESN